MMVDVKKARRRSLCAWPSLGIGCGREAVDPSPPIAATRLLLPFIQAGFVQQFLRAEGQCPIKDAQHYPSLIHRLPNGGALGGNTLLSREFFVGSFEHVEIRFRVGHQVSQPLPDGAMAPPDVSGARECAYRWERETFVVVHRVVFPLLPTGRQGLMGRDVLVHGFSVAGSLWG